MQEGRPMFQMNLGSGESDGYVVISLHGELDLVDAEMAAAALATLTARDRWIIVDLAGLEFIDAAGVAALSRGRRQAHDAGGGLLLAAPQRPVQRILSLIWGEDGLGALTSVPTAVGGARSHRQPGSAVPWSVTGETPIRSEEGS
jgi:anti-anti-sigma factor